MMIADHLNAKNVRYLPLILEWDMFTDFIFQALDLWDGWAVEAEIINMRCNDWGAVHAGMVEDTRVSETHLEADSGEDGLEYVVP